MANNTSKKNETKKVTVVSIPAAPATVEGLRKYLLALDKLEDFGVKTWEKIPGCYSVKYRGKIIGEFYISAKNETYRVSTRSAFFARTDYANFSIIKNGLDLNISRCTSPEAVVAFIKGATAYIAQVANNEKPVKITGIKFEPKKKANTSTSTKVKSEKTEKVFVNVTKVETA